MRHNKIIGWGSFFEFMEQMQKVSPWLSRQIAKRAQEWPFWFSGAQIKEWRDHQIWLRLTRSLRNSVDGEICQGHLLLVGELALRLLLLHRAQEFPFTYHLSMGRVETHHPVDQTVDIKFEIGFNEWERIRLELARASQSQAEFALSAHLTDGRLAASLTFQVAFALAKFLPA